MAVAAGMMSKREKVEFEAAEAGQDYPELESYAVSAPAGPDIRESPESRHFNAWLDRALPLLQQHLAALGIISVTAPLDKTRH